MKKLGFVACAISMMVSAGGCKKASGKDSGGASGGGIPADWSQTPLKPYDVSVDGFTFTITVPRGLPTDERRPGEWSSAKPEFDHVPQVFTRVMDGWPKSVDEGLRIAGLESKVATLWRNQVDNTRMAYTDAAKDQHRVEATSLTRVGDKVIKCTATQVAEGELPSFRETRAMLEAVCDSVKVK